MRGVSTKTVKGKAAVGFFFKIRKNIYLINYIIYFLYIFTHFHSLPVKEPHQITSHHPVVDDFPHPYAPSCFNSYKRRDFY